MTADSIQIICANCGAKYRLPSDFKSASAKCKGCGSTIDVAGQIQAAKAPKPATPPAAAASKPTSASSRRARTVEAESESERPKRRGSSSGRRGKTADDAEAEGGRRRRGGAAPAKKGNPAVLWGSVAAVVAIAVVIVVFVLNGGGPDKPTGVDDTAKNTPETGTTEKGTGAGSTPTTKPAEGGAAASGSAGTSSGTAQPATTEGQAKDPAKDKPVAEAAAKTEPAAVAKPINADEVFDPSTLEPLAYPDYVEAPLRTEIEALCDDLRNGGRAGRSAKRRLEEIGHPALVGVINAYQKIDFKDPNQALYAFEMNKLLTDSFGAGVVSTNFKVTLAGDPIPPETSDWNAKTVNAWRRFWGMYPEKEKWEAMIARRKEGKGNDEGK